MRESSSGNLYLEKFASSGISIDHSMWRSGEWPFTDAVSARTAQNSWLASHGASLTGDAWVWIQGETDYLQTEAWYEPKLAQLIADRTSNGLTSSTNILVQMAVGSAQYGAGVAAAKVDVAALNASVNKLQNAPFYMKSDNLHQNGRGQVQMAYDAFEIIFNAPHIST